MRLTRSSCLSDETVPTVETNMTGLDHPAFQMK